MSQDKNNRNTEDADLMDHNYDGIQEYDNPLPNWWLVTFFGTIIFGFIYFTHYTFGGGQTQEQELEVALAALPKVQEKSWDEEDLKKRLNDPQLVAQGKGVYDAKCAACHGGKGEGVIGPNLTDKFWIHGKGERKDIIQIVTKGFTQKGMPAWEGLISDDEIVQVTGYVYSLRTQQVAGKAPEGVEVSSY